MKRLGSLVSSGIDPSYNLLCWESQSAWLGQKFRVEKYGGDLQLLEANHIGLAKSQSRKVQTDLQLLEANHNGAAKSLAIDVQRLLEANHNGLAKSLEQKPDQGKQNVYFQGSRLRFNIYR